MEKINKDFFDKTELSTGTIISCEKLDGEYSKADIDTGRGKNTTCVTSARLHLENKIGKQVVVITNLEPKEFKKYNLVSEGMILAAEDGEELVVLTTDKQIKQGSKIG